MNKINQKDLEQCFDRLWPITRSITGGGNRKTLDVLKDIIPLEVHEIPSGSKVFDWEVPSEWEIRDAYIVTPDGRKIGNFKENNLHVVGYSEPVDKNVSYEDLKEHIYTIEDNPKAIPYRTSYYKKNWGFALSHDVFNALDKKGSYKVFIDSSLKKGSLTYGDLVLPGESKDEILFSTYICHPSLANDNLSGIIVTAFLYKLIKDLENRKFTYRFVFIPETIGAIAYLKRHGRAMVERVKAGYVVTCTGSGKSFTYKRSKEGNTLADRAAEHVLKYLNEDSDIIDFDVLGSDERQYCSAGFNLPVGSLTRSMYKRYKEYHTSLDNKDIISFDSMAGSVDAYFKIVKTLELNDHYVNLKPHCEPMLSKMDLYKYGGTYTSMGDVTDKLLYLLAYADGTRDLLEISDKKNIPVADYEDVIKICYEKKLIGKK